MGTIKRNLDEGGNSNMPKKHVKDDPSTFTAYGDSVKDSSPPIDQKHKKANSPIAKKTQNTSGGKIT